MGLRGRVAEHQGRSGPCRTRGSGHGPTKRAGQTKCRVSRGDSSLKSCPGLRGPQRRPVIWAAVSGGEHVALVPRPRALAPPLSLLLWTPHLAPLPGQTLPPGAKPFLLPCPRHPISLPWVLPARTRLCSCFLLRSPPTRSPQSRLSLPPLLTTLPASTLTGSPAPFLLS